MNQLNKKRETPPPSQFDLKQHIEAITVLWKGKKKEEKKGFVETLKDMWNGEEEEKRGYEFPFSKKTKEEKSWIPKGVRMTEAAGVVGVGCGIGFMAGIGITDHFLGPRYLPFNDYYKLAFGRGIRPGIGIGFGHGLGCGIGVGFGYGPAVGYFW